MSIDQRALSNLLERFSGSLKWLEASGIQRISIPTGWRLPNLELLKGSLYSYEDITVKRSGDATTGQQVEPESMTPEDVSLVTAESKSGGVARLLDVITAPAKVADVPNRKKKAVTDAPDVVINDVSAIAPEALLIVIEQFLEEENIVDPQLKNDFKRTLLFERLKSELESGAVCPVCSGRQEVVLPTLGHQCKVLFIADEPDEREQLMGMPYVGETGSLVARMVKAMGLTRAQVGFAYVNWCAHNEASAEDVADAWTPFLDRYLALAAPQAIVAFGECAARRLTGQTLAFPHLRGQWFEYKDIPVLPTFHPSALLQHPAGKSVVWGDLKNVMRKLGIAAPKR
jgi:uracil-DNA glycosylase